MYKVVISKQVVTYLDKLPADIAQQCAKQISALATDARGYKHISSAAHIELRELRIGSHRIYYLIENGFIVVDLITYDGEVNVTKAGTKDQQHRQISQLKKEHNLRDEPKVYTKKSRCMTAAEKDILLDLMLGRAFRMRVTGDYITVEELKKRLKL